MSKYGALDSDGGSLFAGHLSKSGSWPGDNGGVSTKEESFDDVDDGERGESFDDMDDGERGGLSKCSDAENDGGDRYFENDMISTVVVVQRRGAGTPVTCDPWAELELSPPFHTTQKWKMGALQMKCTHWTPCLT